ncbi:cytochrome c [Aquamicrobium sp. LC103]|uniref:c-type cytochrome n=1 Tax=Aquamicrobium sp. LC103 TaxID=1120658 RepID=UPI00063EC9D1|nr:cytochrome c [Aquamicrobium sp. LC103]TKT82605.1 cytochrome c [Aquamicrobium sp. LC103]
MNQIKSIAGACAAIAMLAGSAVAALAQSSDATGGVTETNKVVQTDGAAIYETVCQGCHMPEGAGAIGAAAYPKLANNENLEAAGYPAYVIINGQKAMPALGSMLDDEQVIAVVNYIRTHFGNNYAEPATKDDVEAARP